MNKPSTRIIAKIAAREETTPANLDPPLYRIVDLESIDTLINHSDDESPNGVRCVEFRYHDYDITVYHDGRVVLSERQR